MTMTSTSYSSAKAHGQCHYQCRMTGNFFFDTKSSSLLRFSAYKEVDVQADEQTEMQEGLIPPQETAITQLSQSLHSLSIRDSGPSMIAPRGVTSTAPHGVNIAACTVLQVRETSPSSFTASQDATRRLQQTLYHPSTNAINAANSQRLQESTTRRRLTRATLAPPVDIDRLIQEASEQRDVCLEEIDRLREMLEGFWSASHELCRYPYMAFMAVSLWQARRKMYSHNIINIICMTFLHNRTTERGRLNICLITSNLIWNIKQRGSALLSVNISANNQPVCLPFQLDNINEICRP